MWSYNPSPATTAVLTLTKFRLFPFRSPLLRESLVISFPPGTEMFHFPGFPPPSLTTGQSNALNVCGCPIRTSSDQSSLAAPRGVSSPATSFIGSCRLGIHRVPFLPYPINLACSPNRTASLPPRTGRGVDALESQDPRAADNSVLRRENQVFSSCDNCNSQFALQNTLQLSKNTRLVAESQTVKPTDDP